MAVAVSDRGASVPPCKCPTADLPPELLDEIIRHLRDDKRTLNACSLVARSWLPSSRRYLFTRFELRVDTFCHFFMFAADMVYAEVVSRYRHLLAFLSAHPDITSYVRELSIQTDFQFGLDSRPELVAIVCSILTHLTNLHILEVDSLIPHWDQLSWRFRKSVHDALQLPSLVEFHLSCESVSQSSLDALLSDAYSLKTFTLSRVSIREDDEAMCDGWEAMQHKAQLDALHLTLDRPRYDWFLEKHCPLDLCEVRELVIGVHLDRPDDLNAFHLVDALGASLEHLELDVSHSANSHDVSLPALDLSNTPNLRVLSLTNSHGPMLIEPDSWLVTFLSSLYWSKPLACVLSPGDIEPSPCAVEEVEISFEAHHLDTSKSWSSLEAALCVPALQALKRVYIVVMYDNFTRKTAMQFNPTFPALGSRGIAVHVTHRRATYH
ncbi:hypothetical protein BD626DRAFT_545111 [Schizophyllum amplum]|uniref:F-box domain-containing protein n=1 Tax=Schizophyllum amplum TaxID=97359 RepID=A0A550CSM2_9AGAR|nr:hypothetical protein BD626DRAFT_545111 [Auriculariopsis ampla]